MHEIRIDVEKNRMYITYMGRLTVKDVEDLTEDFISSVEKLNPGFGFITDFSRLEEIETEFLNIMAFAMKLTEKTGRGNVVRIVSTSAKGKVIRRLLEQKTAEAGFTAEIAYTMKEAEKILDELEAKERGE